MEEKNIAEQIMKEWYELKSVLETRDQTLGEVKQTIERINERINELEEKLNKTPVASTKSENKDLEREIFITWLRKGVVPSEYKEVMTFMNPQTGSFLAPPSFVRDIIEKVIELSPIRKYASVRTTSASEILIPVDKGMTGEPTWVGELESKPEAVFTFGLERIPVNELSDVIPITRRDLEDSVFDLAQYIIKKTSKKIAQAEGKAFILGDGVKKPEGILVRSDVAVVKSGNASTIPSPDVLFTMRHSLPEDYAKNGVWLLNRKTLAFLRTMKDNQGRYIWSPDGMLTGEPTTLLGMPYVICPDMPDIGANSYPIVFGDLEEAYVIVDREDITYIRDDYTGSRQGVVNFVFYKRVGGQVVQPEALVKLQISA